MEPSVGPKARGGLDGRGPKKARGKSGLQKVTVPGNTRAGQPDGKRHRKQTAVAQDLLALLSDGQGETVG